MFRQIRYFQAVVRCKSFSKAAAECFISQSAISQQIQALERELGAVLLHRENRRFSLTPAGEYFYRKSLLLVEDFDKLCAETARIADGDDFALRVGCLKGYGGSEFQRAVAAFTAKRPEIPVDMKTGNHEELYEILRADRVDLVLSDQRRAFSEEYVNLVLTRIDCHIEISARNPLAALDRVDVDDLRRTPCILVSSRQQRENERTHYREIYGIDSEILFAENLEAARLLVVGAKGFLPVEGGDPPASYAQAIACRPLCRGGKPIRRNYCAFWKADNSGYYIEEFAEILKAQFAAGR